MGFLVFGSLQGDVGAELHHDVFLGEDVVENAADHGMSEDMLVRERGNPWEGEVIARLLPGSESAGTFLALVKELVESFMPLINDMVVEESAEDANAIAVEFFREGIELRGIKGDVGC